MSDILTKIKTLVSEENCDVALYPDITDYHLCNVQIYDPENKGCGTCIFYSWQSEYEILKTVADTIKDIKDHPRKPVSRDYAETRYLAFSIKHGFFWNIILIDRRHPAVLFFARALSKRRVEDKLYNWCLYMKMNEVIEYEGKSF